MSYTEDMMEIVEKLCGFLINENGPFAECIKSMVRTKDRVSIQDGPARAISIVQKSTLMERLVRHSEGTPSQNII